MGNSPGAERPESFPESDGADVEAEPLGEVLPLFEGWLPEEHPAATESSIAAERTLDRTFLLILILILLFIIVLPFIFYETGTGYVPKINL